MRSLRDWLFTPVDNAPLVLFRIVLGFFLTIETAGSIATGWVYHAFIEPEFTFPMPGFEWLVPLPGNGMYFYYAGMAVAGLLVMAGAWFRLSLGAFTLAWTATYLMQTTHYNNHYYLLILLCALLLLTPAHAYASWDARRRPRLRTLACPRWCLLIFEWQIAIVYGYAALAKLQPDWLAGRPLSIWLQARRHYPVIGGLYEQDWMVWALAYGGVLFDGLIVPLLLWKRTRLAAIGLSLIFHIFNSITFQIGIFPYLALSLSVFFFPPDEIRRMFFKHKPPLDPIAPVPVSRPRNAVAVIAFLAVYFFLQLTLPLRHWLYPGDVNWTEEGHQMSWRMMLRTKSGSVTYRVRDPATGKEWKVDPAERLTQKQLDRLAMQPAMIWQFSQRLAREYAAKGIEGVEVYADTAVSLNGRPPMPIVDPAVDLAHAEYEWLKPTAWILRRES